jgi:Zn-dependent protease
VPSWARFPAWGSSSDAPDMMAQLIFSWETAAVAVLLAAAILWAARPRQSLRARVDVRAFRKDVWHAMVIERGTPVYMDMIDRYEFDQDSDINGVMVLKSGQRMRFETISRDQTGESWTASWRSAEIDAQGLVVGDPYETAMRLSEMPDGTRIELEYTFYKGDRSGLRVWIGRLFRPLTSLSAPSLIRGSLTRSGAIERYESERGPAPQAATLAGVPLTRTSLLLFAAGTASFMWVSGLWPGLAILAILVLHELGHVLAMRAYGDRTSAFYLVPFMGGVAIGQKQLQSDWQLVVMVLAGPFAGLVSALGALALFHVTGNDWFASVALLAALINLLNLAPIPILDGGQVLFAMLRRYVPHTILHWISTALMFGAAGLAAWFGSTLMMVLFGLMAAAQAAFPTAETANPRVPLSNGGVLAAGILLLTLAATLVWVGWVISTGDAYPVDPLNLLSTGPFSP